MELFFRKVQNYLVRRENLTLLCCALVLFLLYFPGAYMHEFILRDTAIRYAPMADAFAAGNWEYAFHPRVNCLHPLISGIITRITGCTGFTGAKVSGMIFFCLCVFPLYKILKELFDRERALIGILCFTFSSFLVEISISGLREPHKMFNILLLAQGLLAVYREREHFSGYLTLGAGCALAFCTRSDVVCGALLSLLAAGALEFCRKTSLKRTGCAYLIAFAGCSIEVLVNHWVCQAAIPGSRFLPLMQFLLGRLPVPGDFYLYFALPGTICFFALCCFGGFLLRSHAGKLVLKILFFSLLAAGFILILRLLPGTTVRMLGKFGRNLFRGSNPALAILALIGIIHIFRQKQWRKEYTLLLWIFLLQYLLVIFQIVLHERCLYVSGRYLLPCAPLLYGWSACGLIFMTSLFRRYLPFKAYRIAFYTVYTVVPAVCLWHAYATVLNEYFDSRERQQILTIRKVSALIREHYKGPVYYTPRKSFQFYRNNKAPEILFFNPWKDVAITYFAGGSLAVPGTEPDFIISDEHCRMPAPWLKRGDVYPFGKYKIQLWQQLKTNHAGAGK